MEAIEEDALVHSVAFRVTEAQWLKLRKKAQQEGTSVPRLAKAACLRGRASKRVLVPLAGTARVLESNRRARRGKNRRAEILSRDPSP